MDPSVYIPAYLERAYLASHPNSPMQHASLSITT